MNIVKEYKNSVKFRCSECGYNATVKKGSPCHISGRCSPCIEGVRHRKLNSEYKVISIKEQEV